MGTRFSISELFSVSSKVRSGLALLMCASASSISVVEQKILAVEECREILMKYQNSSLSSPSRAKRTNASLHWRVEGKLRTIVEGGEKNALPISLTDVYLS